MPSEDDLPGVEAPGGTADRGAPAAPAPFEVGDDPPDAPADADPAALPEAAAPDDRGGDPSVLRVAVEEPAAVERVVATVADEPSILATGVDDDGGRTIRRRSTGWRPPNTPRGTSPRRWRRSRA